MALSLTALGLNVPNAAPIVLSGATGVVAPSGVTYITYAAAAGAYTLAAPAIDGAEVTIVSLTAEAHTVTTPANVINGADDTVTFSAAAFNYIKMRAFGGQWISVPAERTNATLSEV